jgi:CheY-specific phosphatase CheX
VKLDTQSLVAVAPEIWEMMLGVELNLLEGSATGKIDSDRTITGLVTVVGDWTGAITVETSTQAAREFAAAMFAAEEVSSVSDEEVHDALAEVTNMCGGSIKNLMPGICTLGIPTVTEGTGYTVRVPRTIALQGLVYTCLHGPLVITIFEAV